MEKEINPAIQGTALEIKSQQSNDKKVLIESYGCAMNFSDSEIVASILSKQGYNTTQIEEEADLI